MHKKTNFIGFAIIGLLVLCISIWWGGKDNWQLLAFTTKRQLTEVQLQDLEQKLRQNSDSIYRDYNLAVVLFQLHDYEEAKQILTRIINKVSIDSFLFDILEYSLGNTFYRLSEKENDNFKKVELLKQSLSHYRTVIDSNKLNHSDRKNEIYNNAVFNYLIAKTKLKLIIKELQQMANERALNKQLYLLLTELRENERQTTQQLDRANHFGQSQASSKIRDELLKSRVENLKRLQFIKKKLKIIDSASDH